MQKWFCRGLVVVAWVACLSTLNIDGSLSGRRMLEAEMRGLKTLTILHARQTHYWQQFGLYAPSLAHLDSALPEDYRFTLQSKPDGYVIHAEPRAYNKSGRRAFYSDETMVIRENWGPAHATAESRIVTSFRSRR